MDGLLLAPVADAVNAALDEYFPKANDVQIIAEPGRYFAEACATLVTNVYGHRKRDVWDSNTQTAKVCLTVAFRAEYCPPFPQFASLIELKMHGNRKVLDRKGGPTPSPPALLSNCPSYHDPPP